MATNKSPNNPIDVYVGKQVRFFRLMKTWSQTDLAGHLGLTFQQVQKYEKGSNRIGASRLAKIAEVLGKPVNAFFDGYKPGDEQNVFQMVDAPQALRLLLAFNSIEAPGARAALTHMAEAMAGTAPIKGRRRAA